MNLFAHAVSRTFANLYNSGATLLITLHLWLEGIYSLHPPELTLPGVSDSKNLITGIFIWGGYSFYQSERVLIINKINLRPRDAFSDVFLHYIMR